jgi:hypothetical protein
MGWDSMGAVLTAIILFFCAVAFGLGWLVSSLF